MSQLLPQRLRLIHQMADYREYNVCILSLLHGLLWWNRLQQFLATRDINEIYDIGDVLGRGAYSVVKTAKAKKTKEEASKSCRIM